MSLYAWHWWNLWICFLSCIWLLCIVIWISIVAIITLFGSTDRLRLLPYWVFLIVRPRYRRSSRLIVIHIFLLDCFTIALLGLIRITRSTSLDRDWSVQVIWLKPWLHLLLKVFEDFEQAILLVLWGVFYVQGAWHWDSKWFREDVAD